MLSPEQVSAIFSTYLPEPHSSLVSGMVIGQQIPKSMGFYEEIKRVGLLHLVVLSGSNISILSAVSGSMLGFLPKKLALVAQLCLIVAFVFFVGFQAPILRAAVMACCCNGALLYGRRSLSLYSVLLAVIFFAIWFPEMIPTLSFQLSFAASIGIILFGVPKPTDNILVRELRPTLAAQLFTTPIVWIAFREFSTVAVLANVLVSWTVAPIMILGLLLIPLHYLPFAFLPNATSTILLILSDYMIHIISTLSGFSFAFIKYE